MCRYAFSTYKSHFACFHCRKTFKQPPFTDLLQRIGKRKHYDSLMRKPQKHLTEKELQLISELDKNYKAREIKCPECGELMADLGLDFKSPKKTAIKEWKIIEGLYTIGINFYSCGCIGIGYVPKSPKAYEQYLKNRLMHYENSIAFYQTKTKKEYNDKVQRIKYWTEQANLVKAELTKQKFAF